MQKRCYWSSNTTCTTKSYDYICYLCIHIKGMILNHFHTGDNFCDSLFTFQHYKVLLKRVHSKRKKIAPYFVFLVCTLSYKGEEKQFDIGIFYHFPLAHSGDSVSW